MLKLKGHKQGQTVALDLGGGASIMLSLCNGDGYTFSDVLDAGDVGKVLGVLNRYTESCTVCQGDLDVLWSNETLHLVWSSHGVGPQVILETTDVFVFEEALKSYCRMLMRPEEDAP